MKIMPEARTVEPRTLCFVGTGTFNLQSFSYNKKASDYRAGETYTTGIHLELASPSGSIFLVDVPKRDILYAVLEALFINSPEASKLSFTWSPTDKRVIVSEAL